MLMEIRWSHPPGERQACLGKWTRYGRALHPAGCFCMRLHASTCVCGQAVVLVENTGVLDGGSGKWWIALSDPHASLPRSHNLLILLIFSPRRVIRGRTGGAGFAGPIHQ